PVLAFRIIRNGYLAVVREHSPDVGFECREICCRVKYDRALMLKNHATTWVGKHGLAPGQVALHDQLLELTWLTDGSRRKSRDNRDFEQGAQLRTDAAAV